MKKGAKQKKPKEGKKAPPGKPQPAPQPAVEVAEKLPDEAGDGNAPAATDLVLKPFEEEEPQQIPNSQMHTILVNYLGPFVPPDANGESTFDYRTLIVDNAYITLNPAWVRNAILADPVLSPANYKNDVFDCDDYVQYLKVKMSLYAANHNFPEPLGLGYLFTRNHAFSFCLDNARSLWLIDTQSDTKPMTNDPEQFAAFLAFNRSNPVTHIYI